MSEQRYSLRCAVYLFFVKDGKMFLLRRKNTGWEDGKYGIPAGHLEPNETVIQAAIRETKEETGINIKREDITLVHVMHREADFDYIDLFFNVNKWTDEPFLAEKDKSDDAQWFELNNLPENILEHVKIAFGNYQQGILFSEFG